MTHLASNLRRLMARKGMTMQQVMAASGLHERTVKGILTGSHKPHARTLHRLASGLDVSSDELFQSPSLLAHRLFDQHTNPVVEEMIASRPELFEGWNEADFDELYSRFGTGGALTPVGATLAVVTMNQKRETHQKVALLLESNEAELLRGFVHLLYQKIVVNKE